MNSIFGRMLLAALVSITFVALPAHAVTKNVNCDAGQTISDALEKAKGTADRLEIFVTGECNEDTITIRRDQVWIYGDGDAAIIGRVRVFSANNIRFFDITITGPGSGLIASGGAVVSGRNLTLAFNEGDNLIARRGSAIWLVDSRIIGDCESIFDENCNDGAVIEASTLFAWRTTISNARYGITADTGSRIVLDSRGGNTEVFDNSVVGVQIALNSVVDVRGDARVHSNRYHAIYALLGSGVRISSPGVHIEGNIGCQDWISYLSNPGGGYFDSTHCIMH